jgi:hypothetical protein
VKADRELELWRQQWQTYTTVPPDLRSRMERQTRMMRLHVVAQVAVTMIFGMGSVVWALASSRRDVVVLAVAIWVFVGIAWTFSLANRRGTWEPATSTTAAFLDLFIIRCQRRLRALAFSSLLYIVMLSFNLAWIYHDLTRRSALGLWTFLTSKSNLVVWVVTVALGVLAASRRRTLNTQLSNFITLRRQLDDVPHSVRSNPKGR